MSFCTIAPSFLVAFAQLAQKGNLVIPPQKGYYQFCKHVNNNAALACIHITNMISSPLA
jgi:hypothetical protein